MTAASASLVNRCITSCVVVLRAELKTRCELVAWVGKMELTDEHLLGNLEGIRSRRTIYRLTKSHCYNKVALDRIVGTPTNPKPDGAARDPQVRRQYITQRWVDDHGVTPGCPRCEGRGTMSHSETCRKSFESIEKEKLVEGSKRVRSLAGMLLFDEN